MNTLTAARSYRQFEASEIQGWMREVDLALFDLVLAHQLDTDISGDLLEIGCYYGKSAIMMGYGLRDDEKLVVCDLFDTDLAGASAEGVDAYHGLTEDEFRRQYARFHDRDPVVHALPSSQLRGQLELRRYRFLHIDGGHAYRVVTEDIDLAADVLAPDGVIVLDDYRSPHTPGVAAAFWGAVARRVLHPFLVSEGKAYAAITRSSHRFWLDAVQQFGFPGELHEMGWGPGLLRVWCKDSCTDAACAHCRSADA